MPKESMSFPTFKYTEIINENWLDSELYETFSTTKYLFMIYQYLDDNTLVFKKAMFWNVPEKDLNTEIKRVWENTVEKIKNNEYERLDESTKEKLKEKEKLKLPDLVKDPIQIRNTSGNNEISEKVLQKLILEDIPSFLDELGNGFTFVRNEYKIKVG